MTSKIKRQLALLFIVIVSFSACAAVVVGGAAGATYSYVRGWVAMDYNVSLKKAYLASIKAVSENGLQITEKGRDVTVGFVTARGAKRDFRIRLKREGKRLTKISVRVGLKGDRKASKLIHDSIRRNL